MSSHCCSCEIALAFHADQNAANARGCGLLTVAALALCLAAGAAQAQTLVVSANTSPCVTDGSPVYPNIQSAVSVAPAGSTVLVCPGSYPELVSIGTPLTLKGVVDTVNNAGAAVISLPSAGAAADYGPGTSFGSSYAPALAQILISGADVTISNITVDGTGAAAGASAACAGPSVIGVAVTAGGAGRLREVSLRNQNVPDGSGGYCGQGSAYPPPVGIGVLADETSAALTINGSGIRNFDFAGVFSTTAGPIYVRKSVVSGVAAAPGVFGACLLFLLPAGGELSANRIDACAALGIFVFGTTQPLAITGNTVAGTTGQPSAGLLGIGVAIESEVGIAAVTISHNVIANANGGIGIDLLPFGASSVPGAILHNEITGASTVGVYLGSGAQSLSVSHNVINDAPYGIFGVTGNTLTDNLYRNVGTLIQ
jgi:hypothetical protein